MHPDFWWETGWFMEDGKVNAIACETDDALLYLGADLNDGEWHYIEVPPPHRAIPRQTGDK